MLERCSDGDTLRALVIRMLTFDGRHRDAQPAMALSIASRALLEGAGDATGRPGTPPPDTSGEICYLGVHEYGRPYLSTAPTPAKGVRPCIWLKLDTSQLEAIESSQQALAVVQRGADGEMDSFMRTQGRDGLDAIIAAAVDMIDHTDPIMVYVDDSTFTNFDRYNNLLAKPGQEPTQRHLLNHLSGADFAAWTLDTTRFLYCMHLLRRADLRAEEFNGRQLTPWSIRTFFALRRLQYGELLGEELSSGPRPLHEQADSLALLKQRLLQTHRAYRWIDSLTFYKEERWWKCSDASRAAEGLPASLRAHCARRHAVVAAAHDDHDAYFQEVVRAIARLPDVAARTGGFEDLLEQVVRAAMEEIPSHAGMTRGMRDLRHFQDASDEGRFDDICAAPMTDGYCAVFSRNDSPDFCQPAPAAKVLSAMSRRMQFNHWHYIPGHFSRGEVTDARHFYYPPTMSDIAEHGEFQHAGHALARVRYSLRCPAPLACGNRTYQGMVDLRLMRAFGHPYTAAELRLADRYAEYLRSISQAVLALKDEGLRAPTVTGFDRDYYDRTHPVSEPVAPGATVRAQQRPIPLGQVLRRSLRDHADSTAMVCANSGREVAFRDVAALGVRLRELTGGSAGARICVLCCDRTHQAMLIAAGLASGLVVCPIDDQLPTRSIETLLRHVQPDAIVVDANTREMPATGSATVARVEGLLDALEQTDGAELADVGEGGLLIYTSGTTGLPKGVLLGEEQLGANVAFAVAHFGYDDSWVAASVLPLVHTFTLVSDLLPMLCCGGRTVIADCLRVEQASAFERVLAHHRVRSFSSVPIMVDAIVALKMRLADSLRFVVSGAAPLSERTRVRALDTLGLAVIPCYGLTESVCFATASPVNDIRPGSAGVAADIEVRVLGGDLQPLPPDECGEIALRGASVITGGYLDDGGGRLEVFLEDGWFLTGDMGHLDADGYLFITGRQKNMIIRGGEKLYLEDLDRCLGEHPGIAEACCVQIDDARGSERAVAFLVARGAQPTDAQVIAHAQGSLGMLGRPDELVWVSRIPRSATGKPLHESLRRVHRRLAEGRIGERL